MSAEGHVSEGHASHAPVLKIGPWAGGRSLTISAALGVIGLIATALLGFIGGEDSGHQAWGSYMFAFVYWCGISIGAILLICIFHAAKAKWMVVLRRAMEHMAASIVIFIVLFIPIIVFGSKVFVWWNLDQFTSTLTAHEQHAMHVKGWWFGHTFFIVRQVLYFAISALVALTQLSWSKAQDDGTRPLLTHKQRYWGAAAIPFMAAVITCASWDWIMGLQPLFYSAIFGAYYFAGSFLAAIAVLTFVTVNADVPGGFGLLVSRAHWHSLGKLLLAFVAFWAYIAFSQLLLTWIANLPEEVPFYVLRWQDGTKSWSVVLAFVHFVVPFFLLLSRQWKMNRAFLIFITLWILATHFIDMYWLVLPVFRGTNLTPHLSDFTAFIGVGGISVAYALFRARGGYTVPVADPFLAYSLRYTQPL